jgi:O-6-methylguanine DNA methyltransferase
MTRPVPDPHELLRAHGLRVTPQRRAILAAFAGGATEHLSADEVHARASATVPELGRGTVYATLAELAEIGLLRTVGSPDPVRYEANVSDHAHFRCRHCLRLHDVEVAATAAEALAADGFVVERTSLLAEGVCVDCTRYAQALKEGVRRIHAAGRTGVVLAEGIACSETDSPLGDLTLAATADGMVRVAYEDHADVGALRERMRSRRGARGAREHLSGAHTLLDAYFAGDEHPPACAIDWDAVASASTTTLQATTSIGFAQERSYDELGTDAPVRRRGLALGANPLAIVVPCHRVTRGRDVLEAYIGGARRKHLLRAHEGQPSA